MTIALLIHAHPTSLPKYATALGIRVYPVNSTGSQFSAGYEAIAASHGTVAKLLARYAPGAPKDSDVVLVAFSAGCWLLRAVLRDADSRLRCRAAVFVDGLHAASTSPLGGVLDFARMAMGEPDKRACVITHSQIVPPYASTRDTASLVLTTLGHPRADTNTPATHGGLHVRPYPGGNEAAHTRQLQTIGPEVCAELVRPVLEVHADTQPGMPAVTMSLGERCVAWSRAEMARENPPSAARKAELLVRCMRAGKRIWAALTPAAAKSLNHCAAFASAAGYDCALDGEVVPHDYRAGAKELMADATARGAWVPVARVRDGWRPAIGDLAIYDRSQPGKPETSWWGHVDRVSEVADESYRNIGANEGAGGAWVEAWTRYDHPRLLGFVVYPRNAAASVPPPVVPTSAPAPTQPTGEQLDQPWLEVDWEQYQRDRRAAVRDS